MIGFDESSRILTSLFEQGFTPDEKQIYLVDGNIGNALGEDFTEPGTLVGIKGTLPAAELTEEFRARLLEIDPALVDFSYGPETYDAVIITALAADRGRHRRSRRPSPPQINGVTRDGEACRPSRSAWPSSRTATDIDYNGPSGPQEFSQPGEPTAASFAILTYGEDNQIDDAATEFRQASALIDPPTGPQSLTRTSGGRPAGPAPFSRPGAVPGAGLSRPGRARVPR